MLLSKEKKSLKKYRKLSSWTLNDQKTKNRSFVEQASSYRITKKSQRFTRY